MPPKVTINDLYAHKARLQQQNNVDTQRASLLEQSIINAVPQLIHYLDGKTTKTEIVNHLQEIGTPDALKVVEAVNNLHSTLKTHKNTDLSEITGVMKQVLEEAKRIPKSLPDAPKFTQIDHSKHFASLEEAIKSVESVIKAQKPKAPVVNLQAPNVNVDAPNLLPLQVDLKAIQTAIKSIVIPEYKTDNSGVEKLLKSVDKRLKDLPDQMPSFSGGGGGIASYQSSAGITTQVMLTAEGAVPIRDLPLAVQIDDSTTANTVYIGKAQIGSSTSTSDWQIAKLDTSSGLIKTWADGDALFNNVWANRASLTYS